MQTDHFVIGQRRKAFAVYRVTDGYNALRDPPAQCFTKYAGKQLSAAAQMKKAKRVSPVEYAIAFVAIAVVPLVCLICTYVLEEDHRDSAFAKFEGFNDEQGTQHRRAPSQHAHTDKI